MSKKILMVVAPTGYREEEYEEPRHVFEENECIVTIASKETEVAHSLQGGSARVNRQLKDVDASDYDAVVFVGGPGAKLYFDDPTAHTLAQEMATAGKVVSAICIAPSILACAGLLNGKKATSSPSREDDLIKHGAAYTGEDVTIEGEFVTARGPTAVKEFGEAVIGVLEK